MDVTLNVVVPDAWVTKVLDAFETVAGTQMEIEARGHAPDPADEFDGRWSFKIDEKGDAEGPKAFGERFARQMLKAVVNMVDHAEDEVRYRAEVAAVATPASDVPDDVIT